MENIINKITEEILESRAPYEWFEEWFSNAFREDLASDLLDDVEEVMTQLNIKETETSSIAYDTINEIQYLLIKRLCDQWQENYETYKELKNGGK